VLRHRRNAQLDVVKDIADRAEALRAYARQRRDVEQEIQMAEIRLRAYRRIGEISRELETAEAHGGKIWLPDGGKTKAAVLKAAGLSTSVAQRCEIVASIEEAEFYAFRARYHNLGGP
jgi:hypothetical protein